MPNPDRLKETTTWTLFATVSNEETYIHFEWSPTDGAGKYTSTAAKVTRLGIPADFKPIEAACVNPLDWDVVWLFSGSRVIDYSVKRGRPLRWGRPSGKDITVGIATKIEDHPVFGMLPSELQTGITWAFIGHPTISPFVGMSGVESNAATRDGSRWMYVGNESFQAVLVFTSLWKPWLYSSAPSSGGAIRMVNGGGFYSEETLALPGAAGGVVELKRWDAARTSRRKPLESIFGGSFTPIAAVPAKLELLAASGSVSATPTPRSSSGASGNQRLGSTVNDTSTELPDMLAALPRRTAALPKDGVFKFIEGLKLPCRDRTPTRDSELVARGEAFVKRMLTEDDIPDFLRVFVPISVVRKHISKPTIYESVFFVAPDWLGIGNDMEWCRTPLRATMGQKVLEACNCIHPSLLMAHQVYDATPKDQRVDYQGRFNMQEREGGLGSTEIFLKFHSEIERRRRDRSLGRLLSGAMKDVVIGGAIETTKKLLFWGGFRADKGTFAHGDGTGESEHPYINHDEYAMGVRLVYQRMFIREAGGKWDSVMVADVLGSRDRCWAISMEAAFASVKYT